MNSVMLDIETWGTNPGSVVTSIGAVRIGTDSTFYASIDPGSCMALGLTVDPNTIRWWMTQPDGPRLKQAVQGEPVMDVLERFSDWLLQPDEVWGNGATFDNVLLSEVYRRAGLTRPWGHRADRCYRTIKNLYPGIAYTQVGELHDALDDAKSQAEHLTRLLKRG